MPGQEDTVDEQMSFTYLCQISTNLCPLFVLSPWLAYSSQHHYSLSPIFPSQLCCEPVPTPTLVSHDSNPQGHCGFVFLLSAPFSWQTLYPLKKKVRVIKQGLWAIVSGSEGLREEDCAFIISPLWLVATKGGALVPHSSPKTKQKSLVFDPPAAPAVCVQG